MTVNTNRKQLGILGARLKAKKYLTKEERKHLVIMLLKIGKGASADETFGLQYNRGQGKADEDRRDNLGMIFMWVSCAIEDDMTEHQTPPLKVGAALKKAAALSVSPHNSLFKPITYETLRNAWYAPKYQKLKRTQVTTLSPDFPNLLIR